MPPAKRSDPEPKVDLHDLGARVISVGGPFNGRTLIEMPTDRAMDLFPDGALGAASPSRVIDAVESDLAVLRKHAPRLADSALAASAVAMALEIEHPFNSATSKSMCAGRLLDAMRELRELAPPAETKDDLDGITARRALRLAGGTEA